jgi:hypothetical protein
MDSKEYKKELRKQLKDLGLCSRCSANNRLPSMPGKTVCAGCAKKNNVSVNKRHRNRKNKGLCVCGRERETKRSLCSECRQANNIRLKKNRTLKRDNGLCEVCGSKAVEAERLTSYCAKCYLKKLAKARLGSVKRWQELENIFYTQGVCPYTGYKLILGVNTSLDHKKALVAGGSNDLNNLQFVYNSRPLDVNHMKGEMSEQEFKKAIVVIYNNLMAKEHVHI